MKYSITFFIMQKENEDLIQKIIPKYTLITDNHWEHIKYHLKIIIHPLSFYVLLQHIFQHLCLWKNQKQQKIPVIYTEDIIGYLKK